jgi:hypothetical protein
MEAAQRNYCDELQELRRDGIEISRFFEIQNNKIAYPAGKVEGAKEKDTQPTIHSKKCKIRR